MNASKPAKGYYSILQFVPDLERAEGANIGVVLFCPERRFIDVKISTNNDHVRRLFRGKKVDLKRVDVIKANFTDRIRGSKSSITTGEDFNLFVNTRANSLRLTEPRPMKVFEPAVELTKLFTLLVGERKKTEVRLLTPDKIIRKLDGEFKKRNIFDLIKRNVEVKLPIFNSTVTYPFEYANGRPNLIKTAVFGPSFENATQKASKLALEGRSLAENNYKLNVVAGFNDGEERRVVQKILNEFNVDLFEESKADEFAELVAKAAHA